jgi:hypothetical protein
MNAAAPLTCAEWLARTLAANGTTQGNRVKKP